MEDAMTTQVISTQAKDYKHRRAALEEISKFAESLKSTEAANLTDEEVKRIIRDRVYS